MPRSCGRVLALTALLAVLSTGAVAEQLSLVSGWRVHRGEAAGAEAVAFDDKDWRLVTVPHDASIDDRADGTPPFDAQAVAGQDSGYLPGGQAWYRRHLVLDAARATRVIRLNFEAVYMDADIWLNGQPVARHRYGYTAFSLDLTGKVRPGDNVIAVRVNHPDPSSRWYAGTGLIRPVSLDILDPVHLDPVGTAITTPVATAERGQVAVRSAVVNRSAHAATVELQSQVVAADGAVVAQARQVRPVPANGHADLDQPLLVDRPALWSPDAPNLYTLVQQVRVGGALKDERRTRFGIRTITVDARQGLRINGQKVVLKGGNIHHDNYMVGAAGLPDADARKVALMKAAGYNAIRSAHNPASQATLDAADALGLLVIDEAFDAWDKPKRAQDYARFFAQDWAADLDSLVVSGRNHPSVLFWSIGNEIPEQGTPEGAETGRRLAERVRRLDPSRPVTQAVSIDGPDNARQFAVLDVAGYNYRAHLFGPDHVQFPDRVMLTTESTPKDAFQYWRPVETMPWVIGDFVWTAVDYIGEAGIGWMGYSQDWQKLAPYPWTLAYCGEIDATGRKRPAAYYREVLWKTGNDPISAFVRQPPGTEDLPDRHYFPIQQPHLDWSLDDVHPSWTWPGQEGKPLEVVVYSEFPEVELFLNDRSLGRHPVGVDSEYKTTFQVPYAPGRLVAVGYRDGQPAGRWELRTAGAPVQARLSLDRPTVRANGEDLAYLTVELADADGTPVYARDADRQVTVHVAGAGALAGMGNGDPRDAGSFQSGQRRTFHGRVVAAVRAGTQAGAITVDVALPGLPPQRVTLNAVAP
ncbi:glycoside hydrolase family 2 TIM barrel-domain containing protein [Nitrospirillum sp. BR 11163]|uniref:glycoside hydrolase family 2 TIM barrel-domain containing protein n=1 Tax=Nitrospirillum sp. BR 11163 TaxID=3104323 RepID=UPI002B002BF6|nr:glycoside hydrolase family 2 TIM barrel-domain containing protein [Nitrospirillum sp. BR 11163]MEA1676237.1 glycoside hydrolase family 2 TIM barrel-domain containing protein [Nitrospirillum sp. BR 11163]